VNQIVTCFFPEHVIKEVTYKSLEISMEIIDFLSQISKLFHFNLLDLAVFYIHLFDSGLVFDLATLDVSADAAIHH